VLKVDIDWNEGHIFHEVAHMISRNETSVQSFIIEVGDNESPLEWQCAGRSPCKRPSTHPRGGNVSDFIMLQRHYGYDVYRVNIQVGREIFDWAGRNMNRHMRPSRRGVFPMLGIRTMKKLEWVLPTISYDDFRDLFHFGTSFLVTREKLADVTVHHNIDLGFAGLTQYDLNTMNPAFSGV
jgi:hypothetical protein